MIATYIQELLATNNRVIIPNYGAFLVRATSKSKDANTLEEKLKDIYFSPFLKFNDELLEKYIIQKEGVTKEQAAEKIKEFIENIKKELEAEKPFIIKDFGQFTADKQGKVSFETFTKENEVKQTEVKKETAKPAAKKTTTKKTTAKETKPETKKVTPVKEAEPKKEDKKEKAPVVEEKKKEPKLEEFKAEEKVKPKEVAKPVTEQKPIYSYKKEKKPVNKGLIWSIAIGLPVAVIFVWALLNFSTVKKVFTKDKAKTEKVAKKKSATSKKTVVKKKTAQVKKDSEKIETAKKESVSKPAEKKVVEKKPVSPQKKYYIIAGSFKNEKYATSYLNKLKAEGYNAEKLAERNGMYAVSYSSFADKRKALAEYRFLTQEKKLQAWILYY